MTARSNDHTTAWPSAPSSESGTLSLDALASATSSAPATRRARLATTIDDAGSSGVIDLGALVNRDDAPEPLTSARHRLVAPPPTESPPAGPSPGFLYSAVGLLSGALLTLGVLALQSPATVVVERASEAPTAELAIAELEADPTEGDTYAVAAKEDAPKSDETDSPAAETGAPDTETPPPAKASSSKSKSSSKAKAKTKSKAKAKSKSSSKSSSKKPTSEPTKVAVAKTPTPKANKAGDASVDCILDPASCKSTAAKKPTKPTPKATPASNRPEKLSTTALRNGLAKPKAAAKVCGSMHAVPAGTKVQVKLSISGATGKVTSAKPLAPFNNTVGRCVADRLADATFEPFGKPAMGVVYSVRM